MWLDSYNEQFGKRLEELLEKVVPETLGELTSDQQKQVTEGSQEFPFEIVLDILTSKRSYEDKVYRILAIAGTWLNATSPSEWSMGPLSGTPYAERIGIGVRWGEISFSPLSSIAEDLVDTYHIWPGVLMEFAHMQEDNRDYFCQRIREINDASKPESPLPPEHHAP
ncbi:hypothetical protein [Corynebacterium lizhenjunii]|uniref:hypothetical protein n=1 Tax=Corynebacterium lizhenjunii TaxID=2709394 RepID=UPI0013EBFF2D|nr:hypothetical protein [Corynebacterium lizhenjunii]